MQREITSQPKSSRPAMAAADLSVRAAAAVAPTEPVRITVYASVHGHAQTAIVRRPAPSFHAGR